MRILHVIPTMSARYGGPAKACGEMSMALADLGHHVEIFTTNYDGFGGYVEPSVAALSGRRTDITVHTFPVDLPPDYFRISRPFARALNENLKKFDVVHVHSLYLFTTLAAGFFAHRHGVPLILRPHGTLDPYIYPRHRGRKRVVEWLYQDRMFKRAAAVHFTTTDERDLAAPYSFGRPGFVAPLGLNIEDYRPLPPRGTFRARFPETRDKAILLFLGRINFKKGLDVLAKAFGRIARQRDDVHLVIAGPDNDALKPKVEAWLEAEGVLGKTTFTGMLVGEAKLGALTDADLFVLPSFSENFGIAVIEAMASGLPVLISDKVNIHNEIEAAGAGKVEPVDAERFASQALAMLADKDALKRQGERGIETVTRLFNWPSIGKRLETVYRSVAERRPLEPGIVQAPTPKAASGTGAA
ncbi:MAG: glycosyltransferase [Alphaproteobacteria bacterium]